MKKLTVIFVGLFLLAGLSLHAGSLDYLTNQSAKIAVTFHRTASTDPSADIANYNPAGTAFLEKGLYVDLSSQMLFKPYRQQATDDSDVTRKYEQNEPTWYLPNLYFLYNFGEIGPGRHAVWLQMGIVAGGGTLDWTKGTLGTFAAYSNSFSEYGAEVDEHYFKPYSVYYNVALGASYSFFKDLISFSFGVRMVIPDRSVILSAKSSEFTYSVLGIPVYTGTIALATKVSYSTVGFTPIIGMNVRPFKGLNIGVRYEAETKLAFEYKMNYLNVEPETIVIVSVRDSVTESLASGGIQDGKRFNTNLPHLISMGVEYDMSFLVKGLSLMASGTVYLLPYTDLGEYYDSSNDSTEPEGKVNEFFGVGWETGIGASWYILSELMVGMGFMYGTQGTKSSYFKSTTTMLNCAANPPLDAITFGIGATYYFKSIGLDVTLASTVTHYLPYSVTLPTAVGDFDVEYKKDVYNIAIGVGYKLGGSKKKDKKAAFFM